MSSFLEKFKRQPKIYIDLPSKGIYYDNTIVQDSQYTQIPVFGMNTMDEILLKTPDALFSGQATMDIIKSCCPVIIDPWRLVGFDTDYVLMAIRIATYGEKMGITAVCPKCSTENNVEIQLPTVLDALSTHEPQQFMELGELKFTMRPLTYREFTDFSKEAFTFEKTILQLEKNDTLSEDEKTKQRQQVYDARAKLNIKVILRHIASISSGTDTETNLQAIEKFILDNDTEFYNSIEKSVSQINNAWSIPKFDVKCSGEECGNQFKTGLQVDYANFFGTNSFHSRNLIS